MDSAVVELKPPTRATKARSSEALRSAISALESLRSHRTISAVALSDSASCMTVLFECVDLLEPLVAKSWVSF